MNRKDYDVQADITIRHKNGAVGRHSMNVTVKAADAISAAVAFQRVMGLETERNPLIAESGAVECDTLSVTPHRADADKDAQPS